MSTYEHTEDARDTLHQACDLMDLARDEIDGIRPGALGRNERAALDRATQQLKAALARISDAERGSRPPVVYRHPGGEASVSEERRPR